MKTKILSLSLAGIIAVQHSAIAAESRVDAIADVQILSAQKELMILRHDIQRLDQGLAETALAIQARKEKGSLAAGIAVGGAALGLGLAALSFGVSKVGGDSGVGGILALAGFGVAAVKTASSAALHLVSEIQKGSGETKEANEALIKARQEILAARAGSELTPQSLTALDELDRSLEAIQNSLEEYKDRENLNKGIRLSAMLSQAAGAAITFYVAAGIMRSQGMNKTAAVLGPTLMTIGNITSIAATLSPSKTNELLAEIAKTRNALAIASEKLQ
ncbi:hypothetical protein [Bdellovibrio sp. HCB337]|uniref:hypothetical protein n=1 Tax=Bdellovibrio sp. HCB337 TaxID=3394358 RepID=UPI0039A4C855